MSAVNVVVPALILVTLEMLLPIPIPTLIAPAPAKVSSLPADAPLMAVVVILSVAPLSAPIVASFCTVMPPVTTLAVPLATACRDPPVLMPVELMLNGSAVVTPLSCTAAPTWLAVLVLPAAAPKAPALDTRMAPALTVITPV